jgi:hypothetical protein
LGSSLKSEREGEYGSRTAVSTRIEIKLIKIDHLKRPKFSPKPTKIPYQKFNFRLGWPHDSRMKQKPRKTRIKSNSSPPQSYNNNYEENDEATIAAYAVITKYRC